jgi:NAD-dependent dihydropyrimidine dehydrogenase PreA subunit
MAGSGGENVDIFQVISEIKKRKREDRVRMLESLGVTEYFKEGSIEIDRRICEGIECKLCIEACPTNALYWGYGEVRIIEDLCVYCAACVLSCIVDGCIKVRRVREDGRWEAFSTPAEAVKTLMMRSSEKRLEIASRAAPGIRRGMRLTF